MFPKWVVNFGYESVTFFFLLSGFILTYVHGDTKSGKLNINTRSFLSARLARIVPAYLLGLVISAPFFFKKGISLDPWIFTAGAILVPLMLQAWFPSTSLLWNAPAWSLSNELFFYASYPALWRQLSKRLRQGSFAVLMVAFVPIICSDLFRYSLADVAASSGEWHHFLAYFPLTNLPQFLCGVAIGALFVSGYRFGPKGHEAILWVGIGLLLVVMVLKPFAPWLASATFLAVVFGCLIFGAAAADGIVARALSTKPVVMLGDASYAIYILHVPVWLWWNHITMVLLGAQIPPALDFVLYLSCTVSASIFVLVYIEMPARRRLMAMAT